MAESYSNISNAKTYKESYGSFLGADYTLNELHVSQRRATNMKNIINIDGENQKRPGYLQIAGLDDKQINGVWELIDSEGNKHVIIHADKKIYKMNVISNDIAKNNATLTEITLSTTYRPSYYTQEEWNSYISDSIKNQLSYGIIRGHRLYIFCGIMLVYGKFNNSWELRPVRDNSDTYIPITTSNISHTKSETNTRFTLDSVNMMSCRRINKLYGANSSMLIDTDDYLTTYENMGAAWQDTHNKSWAGVFEEETIKINLSFYSKYEDRNLPSLEILVNEDLDLTSYQNYLSAIQYTELHEYVPNFILKSVYNDSTNSRSLRISVGASTENIIVKLAISLPSNFILDSSKITAQGEFLPKISILNEGLESTYTFNSQGKIDGLGNNIVLNYNTGVLSMFGDYSTESYEPNISVEFTTQETLENKNYEKIDKCTFGTVFGYNNLDYVFVSGNPNYPNYDWHNEQSYSYTLNELDNNSNLTYFPDINYCTYGGEQKRVVSYSHLEDGILGVHKEYSFNEPNLYIKEPKLINVMDANGKEVLNNLGASLYKVEFPTYSSAIGEGSISSYANGNLAGDKLILSRNGVYGIELTSSVKTNERYAKERSRLINPQLTRYDLSKATAIVWDNKYYLSLNDNEGTVFIGDARYRNRPDEEMNDTLAYEWWEWKNVHCRNWCVINDKLCFFTNDGKINMFYDKYVDKTYRKIETGNLTLNNNVFYYNKALILKDYDKIKIINNDSTNFNLYEKLFDNTDVEILSYNTKKIIFKMETINKFFNNVLFFNEAKIYIDNTSGSFEGQNANITDYYILHINTEENIISITNQNNVEISLSGLTTFRVLRMLDEETYKLNETNDGFYLLQKDDDSKIEITNLNSTAFTNLYAYAVDLNNVVSYWCMPSTNFGDSGLVKIVKRIIVTLNPIVNSAIRLYISARGKREQIDFNVEGSKFLNFDNTDLTSFSIDPTTELRSFSRKLNLRNINFLKIAFESSNEYNCSVYSIEVEYIAVKKTRRVM